MTEKVAVGMLILLLFGLRCVDRGIFHLNNDDDGDDDENNNANCKHNTIIITIKTTIEAEACFGTW